MVYNTIDHFELEFHGLAGYPPLPWQTALYELFVQGVFPSNCDLPTGLGKTSVIAVWLVALSHAPQLVPRRLVYVVNRRTVVDQATKVAESLRERLARPDVAGLTARLSKLCAIQETALGSPLAISTLRGQFADNREWSVDPARPAIVCGTVDMIGSRLLFSGYGCGYKLRPLHAAFLGQDALIIHDEAHLEPAFQALLNSIVQEQDREDSCLTRKNRIKALALTATTRGSQSGSTFGLQEADYQNDLVRKRVAANKRLVLHESEEKKVFEQIARLALIHKDSHRPILIFVRTIELVDKVCAILLKAKQAPLRLTGTLRGKERDQLTTQPQFERFLGNAAPADDTTYLVCTSAGEVGIDISAAHLVCDLATFDSMAQRFGRVNRYGDYTDTRIDVVCSEMPEEPKKELDKRRFKTKKLLTQRQGDASPKALMELNADERFAAFSPAPQVLPFSDILFDAWSLTTIRASLPGRPPAEPYLHGISEYEIPVTRIAWRQEVDIVKGELLDLHPPEDLLADYAIKPHEILQDRADRVFKSLVELAQCRPEANVWIVELDDSISVETLKEVSDAGREALEHKTLLLPPSAGGLSHGMLDGNSTHADDVSDHWFVDANNRRRLRLVVSSDDDSELPPETERMRLVRTITLPLSESIGAEDEANDEFGERPLKQWQWFVRPLSADDDGSKFARVAIQWSHHTEDVVDRVDRIAHALSLPESLRRLLTLAARFHDLGKCREVWQLSIGNPQPADFYAKSGRDPVHGKAWRSRDLCPGYRHEFGSLLDVVDENQEYLADLNRLDDQDRQLLLHLVAAHHGHARPHFAPEHAFDWIHGMTATDDLVVATPRRFARLQKKYGRWGLAYLESLLRAADYSASDQPSPRKER